MPKGSKHTSQSRLRAKVAVIVVGFNSRQFFEDCFSSLAKSLGQNGRIFLIDNNSTDDSVAWVKREFPNIEVIASKSNLGFARANNVAVGKAMKLGFRYIFLLNPDTIIDSNAIDRLLASADDQTVQQPLILLHQKKPTNLINTSGNILHYLGMSYVGGYRQDYRRTAFQTDLALASGAAMWIPAAIIKKIGLFDDDFFMYHEDVDFSWRVRMAGFSIKLVSNALVWHKYEFSRNMKKMYFIERNRWLFVLKNYQTRTLLVLTPMFVLNEIASFFHALLNGYLWLKIKASFHSVVMATQARKKRRIIPRRVPDTELKRYFSSELKFGEMESKALRAYSLITVWYWKVFGRLV